MKLATAVAFSFLATLAAAQNIILWAPPPQSTFAPGEQFVVDVDFPNSLTGSLQVSVAIGLLNCAERSPTGTCDGINPAAMMGTILYAGPYTPDYHNHSWNLYENFTVTVPENFASGPAVLSVAHFALVGELNWPYLEVLNETVNIQST